MAPTGFTKFTLIAGVCLTLSSTALSASGLKPAAQAVASKKPEAKAKSKQKHKLNPSLAEQTTKDWQQFELMFRQKIAGTVDKPAPAATPYEAFVAKVRSLMTAEDYDQAKALLEQRLAGYNPASTKNDWQNHWRQLYLELATVQLYRGDTEGARQVLDAVASHDQRVNLEPGQRLRYLWAHYYHHSQDFRKARQILTELISESPQFVLGYTLLSQSFLSRKKYHLAKDVLMRAIDNGLETPAVTLRLGIIALKQGQHTEARRLLERVLKQQPDNVVARINLGISYLQQKRFQAAERELLKARKIAPNRSFCHFGLGVLYHRQQKFEKAADSYKLALRGRAPSPYLRYNYAMLLFKHQKNDPKGLQYLFEVTQLARPGSDIYQIARSLLAKAQHHRL